jgi:hypothetical protein
MTEPLYPRSRGITRKVLLLMRRTPTQYYIIAGGLIGVAMAPLTLWAFDIVLRWLGLR